MSVEERDPHTGYLTTGHEWNGITELNTPVPHAVYFFLIVTFAFSLVYWVLMPAWPLGRTYTKGLLGADQREAVLASLKQGTLDRSVWTSSIQRESFAQIQADPGLMNVVRQTAPAIFGDNCAACHGDAGKGNLELGAPNLTDGIWLYGSDKATIVEGLTNGRGNVMPAWEGRLDAPTIKALTVYVHSLGGGQ